MSLKEKKVLRENRRNELKFLTSIMVGIIKDAYHSLPTIPRKEWKRDINTISLLVKHRGISVFTDMLPVLDTYLLSVLSGYSARFSGPFGSDHTPKLFRGLWSLVIDDDGWLHVSADSTAIFFIRQLANFAKKANISLKNENKSERKIDGYKSIEENLHSPSERWFMDDFHGTNLDDECRFTLHDSVGNDLFGWESDIRNQAALYRIQEIGDYFSKYLDCISRWLREPVALNSDSYLDRRRSTPFRHGPGATAITSRYTDKFHFREIQPSLWNYIRTNNLSKLENLLYSSGTRVVERPSKVVLVPKDSRGPRVIAAEPALNQFIQQAGYDFIKNFVVRATFARKSIDFTNQSLSKQIAREASISGEYATIDLSDASDRLSLYVIERLFSKSPSFLAYLHACRTKSAQYKGEIFSNLKKFASQGNALTFPLQTLVYFIICLGCMFSVRDYGFSDRRFCPKRAARFAEEIRVFGDDLVIPVDVYQEVVSTLQTLGLKVNEEKSFHTGFFRESCGGDYYKGDDVTPLKIRMVDIRSPNGQQMLLDVSNEAFTKGLWHTSSALLDHFRGRNSEGEILQPIIHVDNPGLGLKCYSGFTSRHLKTRWNSDLHTIQSKIWISSTESWKCERTGTSRWCEFNFADTSHAEWNPHYIQRSQSKSRIGWL